MSTNSSTEITVFFHMHVLAYIMEIVLHFLRSLGNDDFDDLSRNCLSLYETRLIADAIVTRDIVNHSTYHEAIKHIYV